MSVFQKDTEANSRGQIWNNLSVKVSDDSNEYNVKQQNSGVYTDPSK